jgi:metallo-beta-lactamase family protein
MKIENYIKTHIINTMQKKLKLTFCGGVGTVTGANFLLETLNEDKVTRILIDCGMEQGGKASEIFNKKPFIYDPSGIDILLVTHAHIDHIGRIPKLVKDGFRGIIYSTPETRKISMPMLEDSTRLLEQDAVRHGVDPLYTEADRAKAFTMWKTIPYHTKTNITPEISVYLKDAGHVLGSSMIELSYNDRKIVFTGDLGNTPTPLLKDTEDVTDADYIVMESVYGDRNHEPSELRLAKFEDVIEDTINKKGVLIIPTFSLEKAQVLIYELNKLIENGRVPIVPVYIDSPLASKITEIYRHESEDFNPETKAAIKRGDDIFNFPKLFFTNTSEESKAIKHSQNPKIIIAGSGMSTGGRINHHEINYLPHKENTLLLVGYQAAGTLGRQIKDGAKLITIHGQTIPVNARVECIDGYSSHKDSDNLLEFVEKTSKTLKKAFVVMGEQKSALFLVQRMRDYFGIPAYHPEEGESVVLDF